MSSIPFVIAGILIIAAGIYLLVPGEWLGIEDKGFGCGYHLEWGDDFITVLKGTLPPFMILGGLFLIIIKLS